MSTSIFIKFAFVLLGIWAISTLPASTVSMSTSKLPEVNSTEGPDPDYDQYFKDETLNKTTPLPKPPLNMSTNPPQNNNESLNTNTSLDLAELFLIFNLTDNQSQLSLEELITKHLGPRNSYFGEKALGVGDRSITGSSEHPYLYDQVRKAVFETIADLASVRHDMHRRDSQLLQFIQILDSRITSLIKKNLVELQLQNSKNTVLIDHVKAEAANKIQTLTETQNQGFKVAEEKQKKADIDLAELGKKVALSEINVQKEFEQLRIEVLKLKENTEFNFIQYEKLIKKLDDLSKQDLPSLRIGEDSSSGMKQPSLESMFSLGLNDFEKPVETPVFTS